MPMLRSAPARKIRALLVALAMSAAWCGGSALVAAEARPVVGPGATRDDAIKAYGWPTGQSQSGSREILIYPQGRIFLEKGKVERVDFSPNVAWAPPRPKPVPRGGVATKATEAAVDYWHTDWNAAIEEATKRHARLLVLFTGLDWSPASRQFFEEVAAEADFINAFTGEFVFVRLDFPNRLPQSATLREQNAKLRERFEVTTYPSLLMVTPSGVVQGRVDLDTPRPGETYRVRMIAAVREMRDAIAARPVPAEPVKRPATPVPAVADLPAKAEKVAAPPISTELSSSLSSAGLLLGVSLGGGFIFVVLVLWLMWRRGATVPVAGKPAAPLADKPATTQVVSSADSKLWTKQELRLVAAKLAEAEGHRVAPRLDGLDADLVLTRPGEVHPRALVLCVPAMAGAVSTRRVRELHAAVSVEHIPEAWIVAPGGFASEAREFAAEKKMELIDGQELAERLDALPPLARRRMMGGEG
jgi:hypothetical protein